MEKLIILCSVLFLFASCEEVPVTIPMGGGPIDTMQTVQKKVMLEELTGVSCPNCPAGTSALDGIVAVYGDRVIANAIHGQFLAQPTSQSIYDFRTEDAKDLENFLAPFLGKPAAVIDRTLFDGQDFMAVDNTGIWQSLVGDRLQEPALVSIEMTSEYNEATRQTDITIDITAVEDIPGNIKLSVLSNESHLMDAQLDQNTVLDSYEHNHVMRHMLTSTGGDIISSGMEEDQTITIQFSYTVPEENNGEWIVDNMELISFVTASEFDDQVIQAASTHIN